MASLIKVAIHFQAPPIDILEFIDGCIEAIHLNASERGGNYTRGEHDALHKLVELRQDWYSKCPPSSHPTKRPAPPPPQVSVFHYKYTITG